MKRRLDWRTFVVVCVTASVLVGPGRASCGGVSSDGKVSPRSSALKSTLMPGWGQLANGHDLKGIVCFAAASGFVGRIIIEGRRGDFALRRANAATDNVEYLRYYDEYADHFDRRQDTVWWAVFFWLYVMIDAYVDAHLFGFDEEFEGEPKGQRLGSWVRATGSGLRIGIRIRI